MSIINKHISKIKIKDCTVPAWIDSEIRHLRNKKDSAWRRAKKSDSPQTWESFRKLRNRLKNLIQDKYNYYIDSLGATISDNPKRFWSYFISKTQSREPGGQSHSGGDAYVRVKRPPFSASLAPIDPIFFTVA